MERVVCKSCGGALAKVGETTYRCTHCGTIHELGQDDSQAVRALVERNNERWVYINRRNGRVLRRDQSRGPNTTRSG
jgi:tRNA(Ile2) C34 agmatinyltransferase TiaS